MSTQGHFSTFEIIIAIPGTSLYSPPGGWTITGESRDTSCPDGDLWGFCGVLECAFCTLPCGLPTPNARFPYKQPKCLHDTCNIRQPINWRHICSNSLLIPSERESDITSIWVLLTSILPITLSDGRSFTTRWSLSRLSSVSLFMFTPMHDEWEVRDSHFGTGIPLSEKDVVEIRKLSLKTSIF